MHALYAGMWGVAAVTYLVTRQHWHAAAMLSGLLALWVVLRTCGVELDLSDIDQTPSGKPLAVFGFLLLLMLAWARFGASGLLPIGFFLGLFPGTPAVVALSSMGALLFNAMVLAALHAPYGAIVGVTVAALACFLGRLLVRQWIHNEVRPRNAGEAVLFLIWGPLLLLPAAAVGAALVAALRLPLYPASTDRGPTAGPPSGNVQPPGFWEWILLVAALALLAYLWRRLTALLSSRQPDIPAASALPVRGEDETGGLAADAPATIRRRPRTALERRFLELLETAEEKGFARPVGMPPDVLLEQVAARVETGAAVVLQQAAHAINRVLYSPHPPDAAEQSTLQELVARAIAVVREMPETPPASGSRRHGAA